MDRYACLWSRVINDWRSPGLQDCAWLVYSANYLFRTGNIRWAIDPLSLNTCLPEAPQVPVGQDLPGLSFVLLTHRHADHLDMGLIRALRKAPIQWVIPEAICALVIQETGLPVEKIITPQAGIPIRLEEITITPFKGLHWETQPGDAQGGRKEVPAMGYLVELDGKRWLFPGDTRTYDAGSLPAFGPVDVVFAHLWLGRGSALSESPPLLDAFCRFCLDLQPRRLVLAHLQEFRREAAEYWDEGHAAIVIERLTTTYPELQVLAAKTGEKVDL